MNGRTTLFIAVALSGCGSTTPARELDVHYALTIFADHVTAEAHFEKLERKGAYGVELDDGRTLSFAGTTLPVTRDDAPFHFETWYGADVTSVTADSAFVLHTPGSPDISTPARCCVFGAPQVTQTGRQLVVQYTPQRALELTLSSGDGCVDTLQRELDGSGTVTLDLTSLRGPCNAELALDVETFDSLEGTFGDGTLDYQMQSSAPVVLQ
jgi:hypothetical protein